MNKVKTKAKPNPFVKKGLKRTPVVKITFEFHKPTNEDGTESEAPEFNVGYNYAKLHWLPTEYLVCLNKLSESLLKTRYARPLTKDLH